MNRLWPFLVLLFGLSVQQGHADVLADNLQRIKHFTKLNGLSHNSIYCIAQDQRGMIWAGTKSGLNRYDGYRFKVFRNLQPDGPVWNDHIEALSIWGDSLLLVGHRGGFSFVNVYTLKWRHVLLPKPRKSENLRRVYAVQPLDQHRLFVSGAMGVYCFDLRKPKAIKLLTDVVANRFLVTRKGDFHYFSAFDGLYSLQKSTFIVKRVYHNPLFPVQGPLLELQNGNILSGGWANGLVVFYPNTQKAEAIKVKFLNQKLDNQFISFQFAKLPDGRIAITSHTNGVILLNPHNWTATLLQSFDPKFNIPFTIELYGLLLDKQGLLWVSTDRGLSVISTSQHFLQRIPIRFLPRKSEKPDFFQLQVLNQHWVIGVGYSGAYAISRINGKCWLLNHDYPIPPGAVFNCFRMSAHELLLTGYMGLTKLKVKGSSVDTLYFEKPESRHPALKSYLVLQLSPERYLLGTVGQQVMYYHWGKDSLSIRTAAQLKLPDINFSGGGVGLRTIWFNIHHNGLGQLDTNTLTWRSVRFPGDYQREPYDRPTLSAVKEMPDRTLWVGTEETGLWHRHSSDSTWTHLTVNQEIPHSRILDIFLDPFKNVWIQTNTGFLVYKKQQLHALKLVNTFDGIEDEENLTNTLMDNRSLVFADPRYLYSLALPLYFKNKPAPVAEIASVRINGKEKRIDDHRHFTLEPNENSLEIDLSLTAFDESSKIRYAYRILERSENWQSIAEGRTIALSYLPSGKFRIEYAARYDGEAFGPSGTLILNVKAPFYETWWFFAAIIGFISAMIYVFLRIKVKRKRELEKVRQRIASDLHDDLGATLSSVNILTELAKRKPASASDLLDKIGDSTQEMMERVADIVWSIKPDNDALPELVARMRSFAAQTLESMGVELTFQVKGDLQKLQIPMEVRQQLYLLFKEIVNNAAKHAQATEMTISLVTDGRTLEIKMEDNGIGFDSTQVRSGGNGVKNIRQRAAQIDAVCELRTAPGLGTTWMIKLKNMVSA